VFEPEHYNREEDKSSGHMVYMSLDEGDGQNDHYDRWDGQEDHFALFDGQEDHYNLEEGDDLYIEDQARRKVGETTKVEERNKIS